MMFLNTPVFIGIMGGVAGIIATAGIGRIIWDWKKKSKARQANRKAAEELLAELDKIFNDLDSYFKDVIIFCNAYSNNEPIVTHIPHLRLKLDKVNFSSSYAINTKKIENYIDVSIWYKGLYKRSMTQLIAFKNIVSLLKASKIAGFMRSTRLLEEYINRANANSAKKLIADSFAEDYFDEMAYNISRSLLAEKELFNSSDTQKIRDLLVQDLKKIRDLNGKLTLLNMWAE